MSELTKRKPAKPKGSDAPHPRGKRIVALDMAFRMATVASGSTLLTTQQQSAALVAIAWALIALAHLPAKRRA